VGTHLLERERGKDKRDLDGERGREEKR